MGLQGEIDKKRADIHSDNYSMSIGELISIYEENELDIHPEFQRFYRWTDYQKSRLIESLLLGIPIPPIFVSQREDGVWDVIDGLQRLSTILQLVGKLRDEEGNNVKPLILEKTAYLHSLRGKRWDDPINNANSLTQAQQLIIKRSKINLVILLKESDVEARYELFNRLNTGGTKLSEQEVRNCILVMINKNMFEWLQGLARYDKFKECITITDRALEEQYDLELVLRFIVFRTMPEEDLGRIGDLHQFLTDRMQIIASDPKFPYEQEKEAFNFTFNFLANSLGELCFKKYYPESSEFKGGFLLSAFEAIAIGIGYNYPSLEPLELGYNLKEKIISFWKDTDFGSFNRTGVRASTRIPQTLPLGRDHFKK